ncbi:hypothetical protein K1719_037935 [Acacia pycnantha]|nr:hypothetical protein K1719_037935 [Acacia pycnantha]
MQIHNHRKRRHSLVACPLSCSLRAYVHGALIIRTRPGYRYPFTKPYKEVPIILGEWWKSELNQNFFQTQFTSNIIVPISVAFTINGMPGDLYNCPQSFIFYLNVKKGKTYFLHIINTNLITEMFFKVANQKFTVVAVICNSLYHRLCRHRPPSNHRRAAKSRLAHGFILHGLLRIHKRSGYKVRQSDNKRDCRSQVGLPYSNASFDACVAQLQRSQNGPRVLYELTGLVSGAHWLDCPLEVDKHLFITIGMN